jgi:hypothetical protein
MDIKEKGFGCAFGLDSSGSGYSSVVLSTAYEHPGSIRNFSASAISQEIVCSVEILSLTPKSEIKIYSHSRLYTYISTSARKFVSCKIPNMAHKSETSYTHPNTVSMHEALLLSAWIKYCYFHSPWNILYRPTMGTILISIQWQHSRNESPVTMNRNERVTSPKWCPATSRISGRRMSQIQDSLHPITTRIMVLTNPTYVSYT